jgi:hypothetical protein
MRCCSAWARSRICSASRARLLDDAAGFLVRLREGRLRFSLRTANQTVRLAQHPLRLIEIARQVRQNLLDSVMTLAFV